MNDIMPKGKGQERIASRESTPSASRSDRALLQKLTVTINLALVIMICLFGLWDYEAELRAHLREKRAALDHEAASAAHAIRYLREGGTVLLLQGFVDAMSASGLPAEAPARRRLGEGGSAQAGQQPPTPNHHIAVSIGATVIQAQSGVGGSPDMLQAMKDGAASDSGVGVIEGREIVVGMARQGEQGERGAVTVYVSEQLSDFMRTMRPHVVRIVISVLILAVAALLFVNVMLRKLLGTPLTEMTVVARAFAAGDMKARMPHESSRELGLLADEFNRMAATLEKSETEQNGRIEKARRVREKLLPNLAAIPGARSVCLSEPAREVGRDYYDAFVLGDGSVLFCLGDASGHDIPAAMSAAMTKAFIEASVEHAPEPGQLLPLVNAAFRHVTSDEDFGTLALARWRPTTRVLTYASAGHEPAYLLRRNGGAERLGPTGPAFGIKAAAEWKTISIHAEQGDRLFMVTDGLVETMSPAGETFGRERLAEMLDRTKAWPIALLPALVSGVIKAHRDHAVQGDDVTMLAIEF